MLYKVLGAFINNDLKAANEIPMEDDIVDELYNSFHHHLIGKMIEKPEIIDHANYLLWAAHNLERLADRVTNICERTIYVNTGTIKEFDNSDDETFIDLKKHNGQS